MGERGQLDVNACNTTNDALGRDTDRQDAVTAFVTAFVSTQANVFG